MRNYLAATLVVLTSAACASSDNANAPSVKPEIAIAQLSDVPLVARHEQGAVNVQFAVRVSNQSGENITLQRVRIDSMGEGAYHISHNAGFDVRIAPAEHQEVRFWAPARTGMSLVGSNGPVMLRVTCEFNSAGGKFRETVTRVVNENASVDGDGH